MKLLSVNIAVAESIAAKSGVSGIFKRPTQGPVAVGALGLAGDTICDVDHHGGVDQAVYLYGTADYDWWEGELDRPLPAGTFGENLTVAGMASRDILVGDRFEIGDVVLEVTSPRIPCVTLNARMDDRHFVAKFLQARRPGAYARVLQNGVLEAGMDIRHVPFAGPRVSIVELAAGINAGDIPAVAARRYLGAPVHHKLRADLEAVFGR